MVGIVLFVIFLATAIYFFFFGNVLDSKKTDKFKEKRFENFLLKNIDLPSTKKDASGGKKSLSPFERLKQEVFQYSSTVDTDVARVLVVYGTEYGFSREVAKKIAEKVSEHFGREQVSVRVLNLLHWSVVDWKKEHLLIVACSTTGDGVVPNEGKDFYEMNKENLAQGQWSNINFAVLSLGDRGYPHFCRAGKLIEEMLKRACQKDPFADRGEIDQEDWPVIEEWIDSVIQVLEEKNLLVPAAESDYLHTALEVVFSESSNNSQSKLTASEMFYNKDNPFLAKLVEKRLLTVFEKEDDKEVIHADMDLSDSNIQYTPGDALAVIPTNCAKQVQRLLISLGAKGEETINGSDGNSGSLKSLLLHTYDLKNVKPELLVYLKNSVYSESERKILEDLLDSEKGGLSKKNEKLRDYLASHEVADVLSEFSSASLDLQKFTEHLRPLAPRYYSISSSPLVDKNRVSITVAVVRYRLLEIDRIGVATTYIADRVQIGTHVPVFLSKNDNFRLPVDDSLPIIMIGPGTGIAPFRAFLQERRVRSSSGTNVLFFGCRHESRDFLYADELRKYEAEGFLELFTAFSRDQPEKVYVQDRMVEQSSLLGSLLKQGAHVYVCGDGAKMANDVHEAWIKIICSEYSYSREEAVNYLENLENTSRYQRDVWIT
eukprot:jgi/Galph1/5965/GphlegSOOS_G4590.1